MSFRLGSVAGIAVRVHTSWFIVFFALTWYLGSAVLPANYEDRSTNVYFAMALAISVGLFGSAFLSELVRALAGRRVGIRTASVTLLLFGSVAELDREPSTARAALRVSAAGPLAALAIVAVGIVALLVIPMPEVVRGVVLFVTVIDAGVLVSTLLPAYPLDGGRLLEALLWWRRGTRDAGARGVIRGGRIVGYGLSGLGLGIVLTGQLAGLWLVVLGWFTLGAARRRAGGLAVQDAVGESTVADAMSDPPPLLAVDWPLGAALSGPFTRHDAPVLGVGDAEGRLIGVVGRADAQRAVRDGRDTREVRTVLAPVEGLTVAPDERLAPLLPRLGGALGRLFVLDADGDVVGWVGLEDVRRLLTRTGRAITMTPPVRGRRR